MKFGMVILLIVLSFCFFSTGSELIWDINFSRSTLSAQVDQSEALICSVTYERTYIDGIWWIILYQDGVKIDEYPDPNQS